MCEREVIARKRRWANGEQSIVEEKGGKPGKRVSECLENGANRKMTVERGRRKGRNANAVNYGG